MSNFQNKSKTSKAGTSFQVNASRLYLAFYKPFEVLCQFSREEGSNKRTLAEFDFPKGVYSIGRLDYDSEGLLILSDDPRLNSALLDPINEHERCYLAQVEKIPEQSSLDLLRKGVLIEGRKTRPARVELVETEPDLPPRVPPIRFRKSVPTSWLSLSLSEGKNRQVRKMTAAVGHPTLRLVRIAIGQLTLDNLNLVPGAWVELNSSQVADLFSRE